MELIPLQVEAQALQAHQSEAQAAAHTVHLAGVQTHAAVHTALQAEVQAVAHTVLQADVQAHVAAVLTALQAEALQPVAWVVAEAEAQAQVEAQEDNKIKTV